MPRYLPEQSRYLSDGNQLERATDVYHQNVEDFYIHYVGGECTEQEWKDFCLEQEYILWEEYGKWLTGRTGI